MFKGNIIHQKNLKVNNQNYLNFILKIEISANNLGKKWDKSINYQGIVVVKLVNRVEGRENVKKIFWGLKVLDENIDKKGNVSVVPNFV